MNRILILVVFLAATFAINAQSISGSATPNVGDELTYSVSNGVSYTNANWVPVNGTVLTKWNVGTTYYATIRWTTPGTVTMEFRDQNYVLQNSKSVTISVPAPSSTYSITQNCGATIVTRNTNPPTGITWYWQTTSTGTSTSLGSAASVTRTTSGALYLRARAGSTWSSTSQSIGTISIIASTASPSGSTNGNAISNTAVAVPVSVSTVTGATSYRWYTSSTGGTEVATTATGSYSPSISSTTIYYVEAVTGNCASTSRRDVTAFVHPEPVITATNGGQLLVGQPVTLTVANYSYATYQWVHNDLSPITGETSSSMVVNTIGTYKVQVTVGNSSPFTSPAIVISSQNYVSTTQVQVEGVMEEGDISTLPIGQRSQATQFVDGLGRPTQTVIMQGSPQMNDIVQAVTYDAFGREATKYLPYVTNESNGSFKNNPVGVTGSYVNSPQQQFYNAGSGLIPDDANPFSQTRFSADPLHRPVEQGAPGVAWQPDNVDSYTSTDRTIKFAYERNAAGEVKFWVYTPATSTSSMNINAAGTYPADELYKTRTKDEQSNEVIEYKNKEGRVILKKVQAPNAEWAETYYVYDGKGNLVIVLPPEGVKALSN